MFDTIAQYRQMLSGTYNDWHPPVMARLWSLLAPLGPGAMPMLVVQLAAYWLGLGLLARALGGGKGWAVLAIGLFPLFLGWEATVLKDGQLAGALICATGLIGHWWLRERPIPIPAMAGALLCLAYAALVRSNAALLGHAAGRAADARSPDGARACGCDRGGDRRAACAPAHDQRRAAGRERQRRAAHRGDL